MGWLKAAFKGIKGVGKFIKGGVKQLTSKGKQNNPINQYQAFNTSSNGLSILGSNNSVKMPNKMDKFMAKVGEFFTTPVGVGSGIAGIAIIYWFTQKPNGRRKVRRR